MVVKKHRCLAYARCRQNITMRMIRQQRMRMQQCWHSPTLLTSNVAVGRHCICWRAQSRMSACESLQTAARLGGRGSFAMWCRDSLRSWTCSDARGRTRSTSGTSSLSRWRTPALAPQGAAARSRLPATGLAFTGRLESGRPAEGGADLAGRADARLLTTDGGGVAGGRRTTS